MYIFIEPVVYMGWTNYEIDANVWNIDRDKNKY